MKQARTNAPRRGKTYLRKGIHWMPFEFEAWLEDCRKAGLSPEQVGVFIHVISLMWTDQARISDDFRRLSVRLGFDIRQTKRIVGDLVALGMLIHAEGQIWNARADRDLAKLRKSYAGAKKDLSENAKQNNETRAQIEDIDSPIVPTGDCTLQFWDNPKTIEALKRSNPRYWKQMIVRETACGFWPDTLGPSPADEPTALHSEIDGPTAEILRRIGIAAPRQIAPAGLSLEAAA